VLVHDGERSPLPAPLAPGETAIAPLTVVAPALRGRYLLEVDLVHEDVRWFGEGVLAGVDIVAAGPTERSVPSKCARLLWRPRIPRVLHRIWLGSKPLPDEQQAFGESWRRHHPGWKHCLWTDADLPSLAIPDNALARAEDLSQVSELVRYHVLAHQGGVYVDTDVECLRSVEPLLRGVSGFASFSLPGIVETGILGAIPGHPAFVRAAELSLLTVGTAPSPSAAGPPFLTHVFWEFPEVTIFPRELFSPYLWNEPERRDERFEDAYAVHHWAMSWRDATPER
jgi:mannosyltransferase OCH1-like enzyme